MLIKRIVIFAVICLLSLICQSCFSATRYYTTNLLRRSDTQTRIIPVYIDARFSGNDKIIISNALHTWGYSFNNQIRFEIHYNAKGWSITELDDVYIRKGIAIIKISEVDHDIVPTLDSDPFQAKKVLAWVNKIGGDRIHVLRDRMKQEDLYYIILHELGHIFGVMHTNKDELMQPTYMKSNSSCIDKNTAQKAALYLSIDPQSVNWCTSDE